MFYAFHKHVWNWLCLHPIMKILVFIITIFIFPLIVNLVTLFVEYGIFVTNNNYNNSSGYSESNATSAVHIEESALHVASIRKGNILFVSPCDVTPAVRSQSGNTNFPIINSNSLTYYSNTCQSLLEDLIVKLGGRIVERQKLNRLLDELQFQKLSGLVDENTALKIGHMLGAQFTIIGQILNISKEEKNFTGYGIKTNTSNIRVVVTVRIIDIQSAEVIYSGKGIGLQKNLQSDHGSETTSDDVYMALEEAIASLSNDQAFIKRFGH